MKKEMTPQKAINILLISIFIILSYGVSVLVFWVMLFDGDISLLSLTQAQDMILPVTLMLRTVGLLLLILRRKAGSWICPLTGLGMAAGCFIEEQPAGIFICLIFGVLAFNFYRRNGWLLFKDAVVQ